MIVVHNIIELNGEQLAFVIEGMRNPKNSWTKSDSSLSNGIIGIGENDVKLMKSLADGGPVHRKYMRMMPVWMRISAPLYWWKEFDTYKVGTVANSCSTMHKITSRPLKKEDFSTETFSPESLKVFDKVLNRINELIELYHRCNDEFNKKIIFKEIIGLLPDCYMQTRNVMVNYEVLANIYRWRKNHKQKEWRDFCMALLILPLSDLITDNKYDNKEDN